MKVKAKIISGWDNALSAARFTVGKDTPEGKQPSFDWKMDMCRSEHSPLREVIYHVECFEMPWRALWHLVRHHEGLEKFVHTSRPDRNPEATTDLYDVKFTINAQALINVSRVRLCNRAWHETMSVWHQILAAINDIDPSVPSWCVPRCVLIGACPETKCCGYIHGQDYQNWRQHYLSNFTDIYKEWDTSLENSL